MAFLSTRAAVALSLLMSGPAAGAVTVHKAPFLSSATNVTGFETMTKDDGTSFTDGGMTVTYVGTVDSIFLQSQAFEGKQSWHPNGGGFGYTRITFGTAIDAFQFAGGSGWELGTPSLQFQLRLQGDLVAEGVISGLSNYTGFSVYGFSGASFDEVRLQSQLPPSERFARSSGTSSDLPTFNEGALDGFTLDAAQFGGVINPPVIPEPATWALLIAGFGLVGAALRRTRAAAAA
jgi:hypothetical protein